MNLRRIALGVLIAASCFAADVDGNWSGTMATPGGDFPVDFTFKADGAALTGTSSGPEGDVKIGEGKVDGNNVSFSVTFDFGGMPITLNYKGVVAKDEIKFIIDVLGMPLELTAKRAVPTPAVAAVATSTPAAVAGIDGKWSGVLAGPTGEYPVTFTFKADGASLTGVSNGPIGVNPIANGKLDANNLSFSVSFDYNGMPLTMSYKGVMAKDEIKFAIEVAGIPLELIVKRSAA